MNHNEITERAGITYRQLDHWIRRGWILVENPECTGIGSRRSFSDAECAVVVRLASLVRAGVVPDVAARVARGDTGARLALALAVEGAAA